MRANAHRANRSKRANRPSLIIKVLAARKARFDFRPLGKSNSTGEIFRFSEVWPDRRGPSYIYAASDAAGRGREELPITGTRSHGRLVSFARSLWCEIQDNHVLDGAAVLAFFFLLAVFPAAIFVFSLTPSLSVPHLQEAMLDLLNQALPEQSASFFQGTFRHAESGGQGLRTFGAILTLWSGSAGVYALMEQLSIIRDAREGRPFWKARGIAILLLLFFAALAIGALSLVIFGGVLQSGAASIIGWSRALLIFFATLRWIILAAALLLGLAVAYQFGASVKARFRFISPGNVVAALLIALASIGFRFYVSKFGNYSATYGSLAAVIILMLWMYIAGIAVLVGYEIDTIQDRRK